MPSKYIEALRADSGRYARRGLKKVDSNIGEFLHEFHAGLKSKLPKGSNKGQTKKNSVPEIMKKASKALFKDYLGPGNEFRKEPYIRDVVDPNNIEDPELQNLIGKKRVDIWISGAKATLIIEFKSSLTFNDFAAAMAEMELVKMLINKSRPKRTIYTASLHLYPQEKNVEYYKKLDRLLHRGKSACDEIWCLAYGKDESTKFDLKAIKDFKKFVITKIFTKTR